MRRQSFKYIFVFNLLFLTFLTSAVLLYNTRNIEKDAVPVSISTPLVNSMAVDTNFCQGAKAAVIIDSKSGAILFEKKAHTKLPMASTTKIMTALAVIDKGNPDSIVEITKESVGIEGSSIYLKPGEKISVRDLLYGLLLESGNDAATALAVGVFGSEAECVKYMNDKAHSLGLVSTCFSNVHGLDDENHYTTAYELSVITREAMKNDLFRSIVSAKNYTTAGDNPRYFSNHNRLLSMSSSVIGVKTGYTSKAGRCLVSCAEKDGEEYIAVTLCDRLDWQDHKDMLSFAFDNFESYQIADKEDFKLRIGFDDYIPVDDVYITAYGNNSFKVNYKITFKEDIGRVEYSTENAPLGSFGILKNE